MTLALAVAFAVGHQRGWRWQHHSLLCADHLLVTSGAWPPQSYIREEAVLLVDSTVVLVLGALCPSGGAGVPQPVSASGHAEQTGHWPSTLL
mmetsp:Transcript_86566/g.240023  ORF Transcript_86566/g.240023 Transcript_86566/m.240023 type:complete len:92 (+) Transcript_86566:1047-1322(+)|eukprot:CAMPEP_0179027990 /NCGR_PEP_ID=MMETSP0796-20121207/9320_1 /TAXON_ID=73915 /ORGANISM="Pyrodinium bahamense, Strain pbaha01" /LENGTH=91 /DNA_ID=CAMNT_0020724129 /DNA_START=955 /DNA_END=1230 /DNA_ORIENTATION=+